MTENPDRFDSLNPRDRRILLLLAQGKTARQIARQLGMTASSVQHHLYHIRVVVGAKNNAHLIALAIRAGLINPEADSS